MNNRNAQQGRFPGIPGLERQVWRTIRKHKLLETGNSVLVAVSGGADSMALLINLQRLVPRLRLVLSVAHLNHGLRGEESDGDERFVSDFCKSHGVPFFSETVDVKGKVLETKGNLEEIARQLRYDFLRRTAKRIGANKIALGHTLNDQAETLLLRLLRGSGVQGLAAIHPMVDRLIIRPLLECSRTKILEYLDRAHVAYREDRSNLDVRYRRNRIRARFDPLP